MEKTTCQQNENLVPVSQKKKSGIPVPVWKKAQTQRQVLATVSEFQQNIVQNSTRHRPVQMQPTTKSYHPDTGVMKKISSSSAGVGGRTEIRKPPESAECSNSETKGVASAVQIKTVEKAPKTVTFASECPASKSTMKKPGNFPDQPLSLVEEQQQSGIEFQRDCNALRSILTDTGITVASMGSLSEMFRPQRTTEGQGRPVYTPAKMRHSLYTKEPRMSLIDSCKKYKQALRQQRGLDLEEESVSASPALVRGSPKVAVSESPLVKGMRSHSVRGSVYPVWSHSSLFSPCSRQQSSTSQPVVRDSGDDSREGLGTPRTPAMAFSRVPVTPQSSRQGGFGSCFVGGTPGTPSSAYRRAAVTPARRVPVHSSSKTRVKTENIVSMRLEGSTKKQLKWADILGTCSPDVQRTEQVVHQLPTSSNQNHSITTYQEPVSTFRPPSSAEQGASHFTVSKRADMNGMAELSKLTPRRHMEEDQQGMVLPSSLRDFSARLLPVCEGDEGDDRCAEVGERGWRHRAAHGGSTVATSSWSSIDARESQVASMACGSSASAAAPSQSDFQARLQVLEQQECGIQSEMQLLQMSMQKEEEADNSVTHTADDQHQTSHSLAQPFDNITQQHAFLGDFTSAFHSVLHGPCFDLPHNSLFGVESVSMPSPGSGSSGEHSFDNFKSDNHEICHSSSVDSETSNNSGVITTRLNLSTDIICPPDNKTFDSFSWKVNTWEADSHVPTMNTQTLPDTKLSRPYAIKTSSVKYNCDFQLMSDKAKSGQFSCNTASTPGFAAPSINTSNEKSDSVENGEDSVRIATQTMKEIDLEPLTSTTPQSGTLWDRYVAKVNPVGVIVQPTAQSPSTPVHQHHNTTLQVSPPLWTTLALQCAAKNNIVQAASAMEVSQVTLTAHDSSFSPQSEVESVMGNFTRDASCSPPSQSMWEDTPTRRISPLADGNRSVFRPYSGFSKRSASRSSVRHRHGRVASSTLKNPDLFLEALLEDECALYAGRLQSFFRDKKTCCDREELPDPVARILNEGDDMHFIPICNDPTFRSAVLENSAFVRFV